MSTRNRIVLIGNGFDLAHGLKSKYEDFLQWLFLNNLEEARSKNPSKCDDLFEIGFVNFKTISENEFDSLKSLSISDFLEHIWIKNNSSYQRIRITFLSTFFKEIIVSKNWTDIEGSYYLSLKRIFDNSINRELDIKKLNSDFNSIKKYFGDYISKLENSDSNKFKDNLTIQKSEFKNNQLAELLNYCTKGQEFNSNLITNQHTYFYEIRMSSVYFLNFNYTNLLKRYLLLNNYNKIDKIINIHGNVNDCQSIVFGYGDEMDEYFKKMESTNIDGFLEHFKSNYYGQNGEYFNLLKALQIPFDVIVIGHSLGLSDRLLLNTIFEHENCKYIHLQYRGDAVGHFRKRLALSRHFDDKKKLRDRLFPMIEELKL